MLLPTLKARLVHPSFLSLLNQYLPRTPHLYQVISHLLVLLMQMQRLKSLCLHAPNAAHLSRLSSGKICPMMSLLHLLTDHPIFIAPSQSCYKLLSALKRVVSHVLWYSVLIAY